jgi:hypothetical protein
VSAPAGVSGRDRAAEYAGPSADRATWLYVIAQNLDQSRLAGLRGVGGGQVRALESGPLTAVVESVDPGAFSADKLQQQLSDLTELEAVARRHHDVVAAVAILGPALPLRLAAVYLTDGGVCQLLTQRRDEFCRTLGWLAHRTECGIRAWADPSQLRRDRGTPEPSPAGPGGRPGGARQSDPADESGTAYLRRRRADLAARAEGQQLAARCGEEIRAALGPLAVASHLHPLRDTNGAADAGLEVLNAAYLVESASLPEFADRARTVAAQAGALRVAVTGPWPGYSFADGPDA